MPMIRMLDMPKTKREHHISLLSWLTMSIYLKTIFIISANKPDSRYRGPTAYNRRVKSVAPNAWWCSCWWWWWWWWCRCVCMYVCMYV